MIVNSATAKPNVLAEYIPVPAPAPVGNPAGLSDPDRVDGSRALGKCWIRRSANASQKSSNRSL